MTTAKPMKLRLRSLAIAPATKALIPQTNSIRIRTSSLMAPNASSPQEFDGELSAIDPVRTDEDRRTWPTLCGSVGVAQPKGYAADQVRVFCPVCRTR